MSIPKPGGKGGKLPKPEGGDFDPFLKAEDVGKLGTKGSIVILGPPVMTPDSEFSDMQVPVSFKGGHYALGLKVSGGSYARLYKRFGDNPKRWKGKVAVEVKHFKANDYVAVV